MPNIGSSSSSNSLGSKEKQKFKAKAVKAKITPTNKKSKTSIFGSKAMVLKGSLRRKLENAIEKSDPLSDDDSFTL